MRRRALFAAALAAVVAAAAGPPAAAQFDPQEDEDFSNPAFVRDSEEAIADLFAGDLRAREGDVAGALHAFQRILDRPEDALVQFGSPRLYLSCYEAARRRLLDLGPEAAGRYRALFDGQAAAAFAAARARFDGPALLRVAEQYPLSEVAAAALRAAALLALERGDAPAAQRAADRLVRSGARAAADHALLAVACAAAGDAGGIELIRARAGAAIDTEVDVGGAREPLSALLDRLAAELGGGRDRAAIRALERSPLRAEIIARMPFDERAALEFLDPDPRRAAQTLAIPRIGGATAGDALFAFGRLGLYRIAGRQDAVAPVLGCDLAFGRALDGRELAGRSLAPAVHGGRLFVALDAAEVAFSRATSEESVLVAVDVAAPGAVAARSELHDVAFEGPPQVWGDLVLVAGSRLATDTECSLYAFDRRSLELRWSRFLASAAKVELYDIRIRSAKPERAPPSAVTLADGIAYVVTNLGVVAAVDAESGAVKWLFRYNRIRPEDADRYARNNYYDTGGWQSSVPRVVGDSLVVTPEDSRFLYVLSRELEPGATDLRLNTPSAKRDRDALIAVDEVRGPDEVRRTLVFAAREVVASRRDCVKIVGADFEGGQAWVTPAFQIEEDLVGRPLQVGRVLFLPTTKGLYRQDLDRDGILADMIAVPERQQRMGERFTFGNLVLGNDALYSISPGYAVRIAAAE